MAMDDKTKQELTALLAGGKNCSKVEAYKDFYKRITKKNYGRGCTGCACNYLFQFLLIQLKNTK